MAMSKDLSVCDATEEQRNEDRSSVHSLLWKLQHVHNLMKERIRPVRYISNSVSLNI